jgi:phosphoglycolate phosphatase-like HAD superfamily hydrolase
VAAANEAALSVGDEEHSKESAKAAMQVNSRVNITITEVAEEEEEEAVDSVGETMTSLNGIVMLQ